MPEDREEGFFRLPDDQLAVLGEALRQGAVRVPPSSAPPGDVLTGREAVVLRRTISSIIDDELSRRRVLSDTEIRAIAKDVAHSVYVEAIKSVETEIREFLTEEEIEAIVVRKLRTVGLRADEASADETRIAIEGLIRGHKRRVEMGTDFAKEVMKALATLITGGAISALVTYLALKGGSH